MNRFRTALLALPVLLAACAAPERTPDDPEQNRRRFEVDERLPAGSFGAEGEGAFSGDLYVRGHAKTATVQEPFCVEDCQEFDYVLFEIDASGNEALLDFLHVQEGNAYVGPSAVGLGCREGDLIRYSNQSDARQMTETTLDPAVSAAILGSSPAEPVTLRLTKLPLSGGTEAPACYSHFTVIELAEGR